MSYNDEHWMHKPLWSVLVRFKSGKVVRQTAKTDTADEARRATLNRNPTLEVLRVDGPYDPQTGKLKEGNE